MAVASPQATADVSSLCGRWEGKSTSRNNDPTYWKESVLEFKLLTATAGTIIGHGISLWRNMHIEFDVRGTFDWETKEIKLIKKHKGVYNNTVQYSALVNHVTGTITGEYSNGIIDLTRCSRDSDENPNELLSGTWVGESLSRSNDPTTWTETQVEFELGPDGRHGTITGKGMSLWRSMRIEFKVHGTFDWETLEVSLVKQHIGRYTNAVEYSGVILPDRCAIEGHYQNGSISLRKIDGLHPPGSGQHGGKSRSPEEQAEWEEKRALYNKERDETEAVARKRAEDTRMIEAALSGLWEGKSVDKDSNLTKWSETALTFKLDPIEWVGKISGSGVSEWREQHIPFHIEGRYDWTTKKIDLVKQHKGRYTNRVRYQCVLEECSRDELAKIKAGGGRDAGGSGGNGGNSGSNSDDIGAAGGKSGSSSTSGWSDGEKTWIIRGTYAKGTIFLIRQRSFLGAVEPSVIREGGAAGAGASKSAGGSENSSTRSGSGGKQKGAAAMELLEKYETYLCGVIGDGSGLSSKDQQLLSTFRRRLGLSDEDHLTVLSNLSITPAEFKQMCRDDEQQDDTCKICFVNAIDAVILPCGHFSICVECGQRLQAKSQAPKCPICR